MAKFKRDAEKNTYSWVYTGGCFDNDQAVYYTDATPGDVRNFKNIQFEVRQDTRAGDDTMTEAEEDNTEDVGDQLTVDEDGNPIPQKETSS